MAKKGNKSKTGAGDVDRTIDSSGIDSEREQEIGQHIGYRYDVNLVPDYARLTPFLESYMETMGWEDLNWLEDVHMGRSRLRQSSHCKIGLRSFSGRSNSSYSSMTSFC